MGGEGGKEERESGRKEKWEGGREERERRKKLHVGMEEGKSERIVFFLGPTQKRVSGDI